jgi:DHA1 family multidrug resistance protein-like MFS transporter
MALVAPLWGRLSDRLGRKLMLLRATLTATVVVGSMGFVSSPWQLLGLRLLQGTLTGTVPAATALVASTRLASVPAGGSGPYRRSYSSPPGLGRPWAASARTLPASGSPSL